MERLRRLPDRSRYSYLDLSVKTLSKILDQEKDGRLDLLPLLKDSSSLVRDVAVGTLVWHPHSEAIDILWKRLRDSSLSVDESRGQEGLTSYLQTRPALRACLDLDPSWLRARISDANPDKEPLWELSLLLASLKNPAARPLWLELKGELFCKTPPNKLHSLIVCIQTFLDTEEVSRLEEWLSIVENETNRQAFRALASG